MRHRNRWKDNQTQRPLLLDEESGCWFILVKHLYVLIYTDQQGNEQTILINGNTAKDTDKKFQAFLSGVEAVPQEKKTPTLKRFIDEVYRPGFMEGLAETTIANYELYNRWNVPPKKRKNSPRLIGEIDKQISIDKGERDVPLNSMLLTHLEPIQQEGFIIGDTEPITRMSYRRRMDRIESTIDLHGATAHIFRHSYLTYAASLGTDLKTLQSIAGHADIQTTMNRYVHTQTTNIVEAGNRLQALFE